LAAGTYTAVFEIFSATVTSPTNFTFLNRESLIEETNDDGKLNIIAFSHDYQQHTVNFYSVYFNWTTRRDYFSIQILWF